MKLKIRYMLGIEFNGGAVLDNNPQTPPSQKEPVLRFCLACVSDDLETKKKLDPVPTKDMLSYADPPHSSEMVRFL